MNQDYEFEPLPGARPLAEILRELDWKRSGKTLREFEEEEARRRAEHPPSSGEGPVNPICGP